MAKFKRDTILGLVFFTGLGLLLMASLSLMDSVFTDSETMEVYFPDAGGISEGQPVLVLGKRIGKVASVEYRPENQENPIKLVLELLQPIQLLRAVNDRSRTAAIEIQDSTVLGGKQVWINPRPVNYVGELEPWTENLVGETTGGPFDALDETFGDDSNLDLLLVSARRLIENLNSPDSTIGALINEGELYRELLGTVSSLRRTTEAIERAQGTLGRLVYDQSMGDDLVSAVEGLRAITDSMRDGVDGPIARLINDDVMSAQLANIVDDVSHVTADLREGRGTLGTLLQNEEVAANFAEASYLIVDLLRKANDPEAGLVGALMGSTEMRENGERILANLSETTESLNNGSGLLGKLITDQEMAAQFERLLDSLSRAVEDAREAAPVGTFFQVLAAPF